MPANRLLLLSPLSGSPRPSTSRPPSIIGVASQNLDLMLDSSLSELEPRLVKPGKCLGGETTRMLTRKRGEASPQSPKHGQRRKEDDLKVTRSSSCKYSVPAEGLVPY
ncbi:hypothetical protein CLAIMM_05368 [Cladophialophora immunda]|nr:hypothetical protein CLAIMM_05368 [Cladophialophora immunda]